VPNHNLDPVREGRPSQRKKNESHLRLACALFAGLVMALLSLLFGLVLLVGLPAILFVFFKQDERIVELACLSAVQKSYYAPGKVRSC
jgi:hypothetical protein